MFVGSINIKSWSNWYIPNGNSPKKKCRLSVMLVLIGVPSCSNTCISTKDSRITMSNISPGFDKGIKWYDRDRPSSHEYMHGFGGI